jgi:hypothetical protein
MHQVENDSPKHAGLVQAGLAFVRRFGDDFSRRELVKALDAAAVAGEPGQVDELKRVLRNHPRKQVLYRLLDELSESHQASDSARGACILLAIPVRIVSPHPLRHLSSAAVSALEQSFQACGLTSSALAVRVSPYLLRSSALPYNFVERKRCLLSLAGDLLGETAPRIDWHVGPPAPAEKDPLTTLRFLTLAMHSTGQDDLSGIARGWAADKAREEVVKWSEQADEVIRSDGGYAFASVLIPSNLSDADSQGTVVAVSENIERVIEWFAGLPEAPAPASCRIEFRTKVNTETEYTDVVLTYLHGKRTLVVRQIPITRTVRGDLGEGLTRCLVKMAREAHDRHGMGGLKVIGAKPKVSARLPGRPRR